MIRLFLLTFGCIIFVPQVASAQVTDVFSIRVFGAIDNEAPSTTTIQSVNPITFSQIDISWATSTDNFNVFGYVISRDGVPIATTTELFYSDTGLMASTTYSYTIQAFDGVPNYSSSSLPAATTTPDIPIVIPPTTTENNSGTAARVVLESININPGVTSASAMIEVRHPARIEIRIGETSSYEIGYIAGTVFARTHEIPLSNLRPDTTYYYEVYGYTPSGAQTFLNRGSFTTLNDEAPVSPANVAQFTAEAQGTGVVLEWQLPNTMPAGAVVRIVRSHYGYPTFINDGVVVYEGVGQRAVDQRVLDLYDRVYYTAFVIDPNGRTSSGAIALVAVNLDQFDQPASVIPGDGGVSQTESDNTTVTPNQIISLDMPDSSAITIAQLENMFTMASDTIPLSSEAIFTVSVAADEIEGDFKTIVATLDDPRGSQKTFSFLLRLNPERTMYQATIAAVNITGVSDFMVEIYDYDSLVVARYITSITFTLSETVASSTLEVLWYRLISFAWFMAIVIPFLVLLWLWFVYKRREEEEVAG